MQRNERKKTGRRGYQNPDPPSSPIHTVKIRHNHLIRECLAYRPGRDANLIRYDPTNELLRKLRPRAQRALLYVTA